MPEGLQAPAGWQVYGWSRPRIGEQAAGDGWKVRWSADGCQILLCDVLGHGARAAADAQRLVAAYAATAGAGALATFWAVEQEARSTRGCALAIIALAVDQVEVVAMGNLRVWLVAPDAPPRVFVAAPGVVGRTRAWPARHQLPAPPGTWVVAGTDGIRTGFHPDGAWLRRTGVVRAPALIVSQWGIPMDDATAVVAMRGAPGQEAGP